MLQSGVKSPPRPLLPVKLPVATYGMELAVFGLHVSHVFCMYLHPRHWPNCSAAQLTWNKGAMWGEGKRSGNAFEAEEGDEKGKRLIRQRLQQWIDAQHWMVHRDVRGYKERIAAHAAAGAEPG